jgi:glycosyltransferase involved in cell wall biosynthesis
LSHVQFDAIYSSSGPPTCHLIANRLQRISGVPWIADYRDLWSHNHYLQRGPLWEWAEECFERLIVRRAACLVTVTKPWGEELARFTGQRVVVIPHGFDAQDFEDLPAYDPGPEEPFVLLYAGTLYPGYQDPTPLFQAVRMLHEASHIHPGDFLIRFVGTDPDCPAGLAREFQIADYLAFTPIVPYAKSLQMQSQASALLLFKWKDDQETGVCPAKLYEYFGAGRPILALGDKRDVVDDILEDCEAGVSVASAEEAADVLRSWIATFKSLGRLPWHFNREHIGRYTRSEAVRALADLLNLVVSGGSCAAFGSDVC